MKSLIHNMSVKVTLSIVYSRAVLYIMFLHRWFHCSTSSFLINGKKLRIIDDINLKHMVFDVMAAKQKMTFNYGRLPRVIYLFLFSTGVDVSGILQKLNAGNNR